MKLLSFLISICLLATLSWAGPSVTVGVGPYRVPRYCAAQGGKALSLPNSTKNFKSFCFFKGGALIDGWTLFKNRSSSALAVEVFLNTQGRGKNAVEFCENSGGQILEYFSEKTTIQMCSFSDSTAIEVKTLFNGPQNSKNKALVNALLNPKEK